MSDFLRQIHNNLCGDNLSTALVINGKFHTYRDLSCRVAEIQKIIVNYGNQQNIAVYCHQHLDTYACILAIWLSGKTFVPLNPNYPILRNQQITESTKCKILFDPHNKVAIKNCSSIKLIQDTTVQNEPQYITSNFNVPLYILFTSGSSGKPKGITITHANFNAFLKGSLNTSFVFTSNDRFLQMYDLTFDGSFQAYVIPLMMGASFYTIDTKQIKHLAIIKAIMDYKLTIVKMTPTVLQLTAPYFKSIFLPSVRYSIFGGETLNTELANAWQACVPNAEIVNVYGPSEASVNCFSYFYNKSSKPDTLSVPIGKAHKGISYIIVDKKNKTLNKGQVGELCISGKQVFSEYIERDKSHKTLFIESDMLRYYKTGDLVLENESGNLLFKGRMDNQIQIHGYRVELDEIEAICNKCFHTICAVSALYSDILKTTELCLFMETSNNDEKKVRSSLTNLLPSYMIPSKVVNLISIPLLTNGKIDRQAIKHIHESFQE